MFVFNPITGEVREVYGHFIKQHDPKYCFEKKEQLTQATKRKLMADCSLEDEVFRYVSGTSGVYISNYGRVKKIREGKDDFFYIPIGMRSNGVFVKIIRNEKKDLYKIAKLVAEFFEIKDKYKFQTCEKIIYHVDKNCWNNHLSNLIYVKHIDLVKEMNRSRQKEVIKVDARDKSRVLEYYPSILKAAEDNFMSSHTVRRYIARGRQTYDGCIFAYVKEK